VVTASQLVLTATATQAPGATNNLTITAKDATGTTATNYAGDIQLMFSGASASPNGTQPTVTNKSGATAVNFGSQESITFAAGVASTTTTGATGQLVMRLFDSQTASIVVSDGTISNGTGVSVVVSSPTAAPSSSSGKYHYVQAASPAADQINADNGTVPSGTSLVAIETTGPHPGNQYTSAAAASNGSVSAFNVDNASAGTVAYSFAQADAWGNIGPTVGPFSFTDNG
jgi:hypothetical protein